MIFLGICSSSLFVYLDLRFNIFQVRLLAEPEADVRGGGGEDDEEDVDDGGHGDPDEEGGR